MIKQKFMDFYSKVVEDTSKLSYGKRLKVGAIIVKNDSIISYGYNGTPPGFDNDCEYEVEGKLVTKDEVIHAEMNAILKVARSNNSTENSIMFVTHAPCIPCAKHIYSCGISEVYYLNDYKDKKGVDFLKEAGIIVHKVNNESNSI